MNEYTPQGVSSLFLFIHSSTKIEKRKYHQLLSRYTDKFYKMQKNILNVVNEMLILFKELSVKLKTERHKG